MRKRPQRTCVGCRQTGNKRGLIRVVRTPEGRVAIDPTGKQAGRGAYLCANRRCWKTALDQKQLNRALKMTLSEEDVALLRAHAETLPDVDPAVAETDGA